MEKVTLLSLEEETMREGEHSNNVGKHGKNVELDVDALEYWVEFMLGSTCGEPSFRPTIFKVPEDIRNDDQDAYSPKVVCITLFHREMLKLKGLEEVKLHYLEKVLSHSKNNLNLYIQEMKKTAIEARFCYSGYPKSEGMETWFEDFLKMLLVDGCFIINLLVQLEDGLVEINDPIYSDRWTLPRVGHDMLPLENQIPFSVLEKLWELTGRERPALKTKVLQIFCSLLPNLEVPEAEQVHHLLHLIHLSLQPISPMKKPESTSSTPKPDSLDVKS